MSCQLRISWEEFLITVREQDGIAQREHEHLLLFIFGHGDVANLGVAVGGYADAEQTSLLHIKDINRLLPRTLEVTLITTSCYSGGWLVRPDITRSRQYLNAKGIGAAAEDQESHSLLLSNCVGRASGSIAASAILRCLIDVDELSEEVKEHPTYMKLGHSIFETVNDMHLLGAEQQMHFSAQHDDWEENYAVRLRLPL